MDIAQIVQLGIGASSLFILMKLWDEMKIANQFQRDTITRLLDERDIARAERVAIMKQIGIDPHDSGIYKLDDLDNEMPS